MIKEYYRLVKPGILYGNLLVAAAGYVFADIQPFDISKGLWMLAGLAGVIACGCVLNNYFDRKLDAKMQRTRSRALVTGAISAAHALLFAGVLGIAGVGVLALYTNMLTLGVALAAAFIYVCVYTPLKPRTPYALFVGALSGAAPAVVGYTAAANTLDAKSLFVFIFLFAWQIPHFLAIATYRYDEYTAAGVPLFIKHSPSLKARALGRKIFYLSLVVLLVFCGALILQRWMM